MFIALKNLPQELDVYINTATLSTTSNGSVEGMFSVTVVLDSIDLLFSLSEFTISNASLANLHTTDYQTFTFNAIPNSGGDIVMSIPARNSNTLIVTVNVSWKFLTKSTTSDVYIEFRELVSDNAVAVRATDPAINDLSGNSRNLSLINTPLATNFLNSADVLTDVMAARFATTNAFSIGETGSTFFSRVSGFSGAIGVRCNDGQSTTKQYLCGNFDGTHTGFTFAITTVGKIELNFLGNIWLSTSAQFIDGNTGLHYFDFHYDFANSTLTVYKDNVSVAGSFTSGSISPSIPSTYNCTANFYIGSYNNNGTAFSNPAVAIQITYFTITTLQSSNRSSIYTYLVNREANISLASSLSSILFPHDIQISDDLNVLYAIGKGDDSLTTVDGAVYKINISNPLSPTLTGQYSGHGNLKDGETIIILSSTRIMAFADKIALILDVSGNNPTLVKSITCSGSSVNGAARSRLNQNYVFGANKGGYIQVFDTTTIDTTSLVGEKDCSGDGLGGCHDVKFTDDGQHIIVCNRITGSVDIGIYQVLNSDGSLIPLNSWTLKGSLSDGTITDTNRIEVLSGENAISAVTTGNTSTLCYTVDISTLTSPSLLASFNVLNKSTGLGVYRNRFSIPTWTQGLRVLKTDSPATITEIAGYCNTITFTAGNANFHEVAIFEKSGITYIVVAAQSSSKVLIFKWSRI